jgi:hypothetical protein
MRVYRRSVAALGILLVLPLAAAIVAVVELSFSCDYDCGDSGGRGLFLLVLLCTPPAAVGLLLVTMSAGRQMQGLTRLLGRLIAALVVVCTLVLAGAAIASLAEGVSELTSEPQVHQIGQTEPSDHEYAQAREAGIWWLAIGTILAAMAATSVLALRAAWRKRR